MLAITLLMALLVACGGGNDSTGDSLDFVTNDLTGKLRQANAEHYAFGCVDLDGTVLSGDYSPDAIADDAELEHAADSWTAGGARGVILGGDDDQQYIVIYDPASEPTNAEEFDRREVEADGGALTCFVPK